MGDTSLGGVFAGVCQFSWSMVRSPPLLLGKPVHNTRNQTCRWPMHRKRGRMEATIQGSNTTEKNPDTGCCPHRSRQWGPARTLPPPHGAPGHWGDPAALSSLGRPRRWRENSWPGQIPVELRQQEPSQKGTHRYRLPQFCGCLFIRTLNATESQILNMRSSTKTFTNWSTPREIQEAGKPVSHITWFTWFMCTNPTKYLRLV